LAFLDTIWAGLNRSVFATIAAYAIKRSDVSTLHLRVFWTPRLSVVFAAQAARFFTEVLQLKPLDVHAPRIKG